MSEIPYLKKKNKYGSAAIVDRGDASLLDRVTDELYEALEKKDRAAFRQAASAFIQLVGDEDAAE